MNPDNKIDGKTGVIIVGGFLGSGKTTLIREAIQHPDLKGTVLLINEAAELGVDDRLLRGGASPVVLLANGCLCCTANEGLRELLHGILTTFADYSRSRRIIIEMSGLADPPSVIAAITEDSFLANHLRIEFVVTLIDCMHLGEKETSSDDYRRQVLAADILLLSKSDLVSIEQIDAANDFLDNLHPLALRFLTHDKKLNELLELGPSLRADRVARRLIAGLATSPGRNEASASSLYVARCGSLREHALHPETFSIKLGSDLNWERFAIWLSFLLHCHGDRVLRIKGFIWLEEGTLPVLINCIHHVAYFPEHVDAGEGDDSSSFLVFIVVGLSAESVLRSFRTCVQRETAYRVVGNIQFHPKAAEVV